MKLYVITLTIFLFTLTAGFAQTKPQMRQADKVRIKEAITLSKQFGNEVWKGYSEIPFTVLLVTDSTEFLINYPKADPGNDFRFLEYDSDLSSKIYVRKRQFSPHLLATFPAINGVNCIIVGTPENTKQSSTEWIITLLHEHFHQYEQADPDYFESVAQADACARRGHLLTICVLKRA